jgi:2-C-methyl-D-erythritol 4-phosphate cytidylyltransferase
MTTTAILLAGGSGARLGTGDNKAYLELGGHPLLAWSLAAFERCALVDDVVLVTRTEDHDRARSAAAAVGASKLRDVVTGGATRHGSEQAGLESIAPAIASGHVTLVAIHDAARPFITGALLERLLLAAAEHGGAVPGLAVGPALLVRVDRGVQGEQSAQRPAPEATAIATAALRRMQTPQAFHAAGLLAAYRAATAAGFDGVDTAETVEHHGALEVVVVPGDPDNRKITYADDLAAAAGSAASRPERPHV